MTRSEATSIFESTTRALRELEGMSFPWAEIPRELQHKVLACHKKAIDEISRVRDMAKSELEK